MMPGSAGAVGTYSVISWAVSTAVSRRVHPGTIAADDESGAREGRNPPSPHWRRR